MVFGLDPLIKTLVAYTNQDEIKQRLHAMFDKLDSDRSGALRYAKRVLHNPPKELQKSLL